MFSDPVFAGPDQQVGGGELQDLTAEILDAIAAFVRRFVVYPSHHERVAHVLWIAHCWLMDYWESTPRIAFLSPEPGSGKSRALEVTEPLVPRPVHAVNTTPAYLFRKVSDPDGLPTLLYDEIDTVFGPRAKDNEEIRGMLNAGHRNGAMAGRCVVRGKEVFTEELPAYCAVALAGLDDLPDTLMSRSVVVRMRRRAADERVEPWRLRLVKSDAQRLYDNLAAWSSVAKESLVGDFWPKMPKGVDDRDADVWEALLVVADLAGARWAKAARVAAVTLVTASKRRPPSIGVLLLRDIKRVFDGSNRDRLPTEELITALLKLPESPWPTIRRGEPIDDRSLAQRLRKYGVTSKAHRDGGSVFKGYAATQFADAWKRYVDGLIDDSDDDEREHASERGDSSVTPVTSVTNDETQLQFVTGVTDVTESNGQATGEARQFTPPTGPGRCPRCGCHVATQGHKPDCPVPAAPGGITAATPGVTDRVAAALAKASGQR